MLVVAKSPDVPGKQSVTHADRNSLRCGSYRSISLMLCEQPQSQPSECAPDAASTQCWASPSWPSRTRRCVDVEVRAVAAVAVLEPALADPEVGRHRERVVERGRPVRRAGRAKPLDVERRRIRHGVPQQRREVTAGLGREPAQLVGSEVVRRDQLIARVEPRDSRGRAHRRVADQRAAVRVRHGEHRADPQAAGAPDPPVRVAAHHAVGRRDVGDDDPIDQRRADRRRVGVRWSITSRTIASAGRSIAVATAAAARSKTDDQADQADCPHPTSVLPPGAETPSVVAGGHRRRCA